MNDDMLEYIEKERAKRSEEERAMYEELRAREAELSEYRSMLRQRENELENHKNQLKQEQLDREKIFRDELKQRDRLIEERERELYARQSEMEEHFQKRFQETEQLRTKLQNELTRKEEELKNLLIETEKEKDRYREESRKSIESKSQKFVDSALQLLEKKETKFHNISRLWAILGALSIVAGIAFAIYAMITGADSFHQANNSSLSYYIYTLFRGIIVVGLFGALARYAFVFSNSFMHESLKSGERLHAIKFGEFYLDAYGADADWDQLKEAFEHWNISGQSAFSKKAQSENNNEISDVISTAIDKAACKIADTKASKQ